MRFSSHYKMNNDDIIDYVFEHTDFFSSNENLVCEEIGDGNINYVYRIFEKSSNAENIHSGLKTQKSLILKQADVQTRVRPDGFLNPDRSAREAEVLKIQFSLAPEFIPKVFYSDKVMAIIIMEDIGSYTNLKKELMKASILPELGKKLSQFIIKTTLPLTELIIGYEKKSEAAKKFYNPELCKITEELVFTHPYNDLRGRNILFKENEQWLKSKLYNNTPLAAAAAHLKERFCNYPQSLIHGDLHSASVFVNGSSSLKNINLKIIDPEFAFYGPIGYDLGNVLAHFIFAETYVKYTKEISEEKKNIFLNFMLKTKHDFLTNFFTEGAQYLQSGIKDSAYKNKIFIANYLKNTLKDAIGFCGAELNRRVIGSAKTAEITSITEENKTLRIQLEQDLVNTGIKMMLNTDSYIEELFCK
ncbi:S-methyl-5-thioribose kinase [Treponema pedis]|uniref:S-methyl-5-thioribose kinase n=1 Tax=Treponema pedis TaxID=409322 RepID=A0A7S7AVV1_9SPIR|nr:S-methyl-5-thioribose kinase [Treponema pedis]QOW60247.1 phosphotransferase [Treponema pedis]